MKAVPVAENIWWVGAIDWNARHFHGHTYTTKRGTTYNAYLIIDEKITLIDAVYGPFADEMLQRIRTVIPPEKIDTIIANHIEPDHSGAYPGLLKFCPKAKMYGSARAGQGLERYYHRNFDFTPVKTGDELSLGKRTLVFIEIPMIHWPDSMMTYLIGDQILFSNDAFGQHYATSERFDDEVPRETLMEETVKYYANILWPFSHLIAQRLAEIEKLGIPIRMIATSHGLIWRKEPGKIISAYKKWAGNATEPKVVIVYETMWGSTARMARKIAEGVADAGVKHEVYDIAATDRTEVIYGLFNAKGYIFGSSNHDSGMLPNMVSFMEFLKGLHPRNRIGAAFGSYGWSGLAIKKLEETMKEAGVEIAQPALSVVYAPDASQLAACYEFGKKIAETVKKG
ncbi:MAG TPA: flavodoxin domain-containing protein [Candidatus Omnitrophota bacterium]|jgi:flavorubredoxin|nr:flavodoxin domain-containing protein [Candidatus Omnitrophota bacterium]